MNCQDPSGAIGVAAVLVEHAPMTNLYPGVKQNRFCRKTLPKTLIFYHIFIFSLGNWSRNGGFWWILDIYLGLQNSLQTYRIVYRCILASVISSMWGYNDAWALRFSPWPPAFPPSYLHRSCWHKLQLITRPCSTRDGFIWIRLGFIQVAIMNIWMRKDRERTPCRSNMI